MLENVSLPLSSPNDPYLQTLALVVFIHTGNDFIYTEPEVYQQPYLTSLIGEGSTQFDHVYVKTNLLS